MLCTKIIWLTIHIVFVRGRYLTKYLGRGAAIKLALGR